MGLSDYIARLVRAPAVPHTTVFLAEPDPGPAPRGAPGYFQVRLSDMRLRDERRWNLDIVPATFFLVDFNYGAATVRRPFFVSNGLLTMMPDGIDSTTLRVRFRDTLVVGPTPYAGGDVGLFVGLFQTAIDDRRKDLFSVFETLFGQFDPGLLSPYVKIADKLSEEIFRCLSGADMQCLLAEHRVVGPHALPPRGYLAYLRSHHGAVDKNGLAVRDGELVRDDGKQPLGDLDYCLVKLEHLAVRNDYTTMNFHKTWSIAREKMRENQAAQAQAMMIECARQIEGSADLSEDDKVALIELYQSKLLATRPLALPPGTGSATRSGRASPVRKMQARATLADDYDDELLAEPFNQIAKLTTRLSDSPSAAAPIEQADIVAYLREGRTSSNQSAHRLVQALAVGSIAT